MEGGDLIELLAHDEEDGVKEINELGEEVPPSNTEHSQGIFII